MKIVVIGASTGGPKALLNVVRRLPHNLNASAVLVQHLPIAFTQSLAGRLDRACPLPVTVLEHEKKLEKAHVYIVPGDRNMLVVTKKDGQKITYLIVAVQHPQPSISTAFASIAEHFGKDVIGVVLTGMGDDGLTGARAIKNFGGTVIAQDQKSSVVYGMPKAVRDIADIVLPLDRIASHIVELTKT
jgi:two-component system chemotaxis response regulator CheB